jgi:hypothetical protein
MNIENTINGLAMEANRAGSFIIRLIGNHELWNRTEKDCTYASEKNLGVRSSASDKEKEKACAMRHERFKPNYDIGAALSKCGGVRVCFFVDGIFACHGGVNPEVARALHAAGKHISELNTLASKVWNDEEMTDIDKQWFNYAVAGPQGLLMDRSLGTGSLSKAYINDVFDALELHYAGVHTIVVGHTIQPGGKPTIQWTDENNRYVVRVDTGMSRSFMSAQDTQSGDEWIKQRAHVYKYDIKTRRMHVL